MIRNYITVAWRILRRNKLFSFLNIVSLVLGLIPCVLLVLFYHYDWSFDRHHPEYDRIYRTVQHSFDKNGDIHTLRSSPQWGKRIEEEFPGIGEVTRLLRGWEAPILRVGEKVFSEKSYFWADQNVLNIFNIPLAEGDPETALREPRSIVLKRDFARKYFNGQDPMGQVIFVDIWVNFASDNEGGIDPKGEYVVTGVIDDVPGNSHLEFDFLFSSSSLQFWEMYGMDLMHLQQAGTYIKLAEDVTPEDVESKMNSIALDMHRRALQQLFAEDLDTKLESGSNVSYSLIPITDIYSQGRELRPNYSKTAEPDNLFYFFIISIIVLGIGCINFINLSTARALRRSKEIGLRKVVGGIRSQLIFQFLTESILLSVLSLLIALGSVALVIPDFNQFMGTDIIFGDLFNSRVSILLIVVTVTTGLIAGIYPSWVISSFSPVRALKGKVSKSGSSVARNFLVFVQYGISTMFILGSFIVFDQISEMRNADLGYDKENTIVIDGYSGNLNFLLRPHADKYYAIKDQWESVSSVRSVSGSSWLFGAPYITEQLFRVEGSPRSEAKAMRWTFVENGLMDEFDIEYVKHIQGEEKGIYLSESALRQFGSEEEIMGQYLIRSFTNTTVELSRDLDSARIIGVVKDINFQSAQVAREPLVMIALNNYEGNRVLLKIFVKFEGNPSETIAALEEGWKDVVPDIPFQYYFLDEEIDKYYAEEEKISSLFMVFSIFSVVIACLGILGLSTYSIQRRSREISIRKIFGASAMNLILLFSRKYSMLIGLALLMFVPVSYYFGMQWLENYPVKTYIDPVNIFATAIIIILLSSVSILGQLLKGIRTNPTEMLKSDDS